LEICLALFLLLLLACAGHGLFRLASRPRCVLIFEEEHMRAKLTTAAQLQTYKKCRTKISTIATESKKAA